jgi:hypothetical protein
MAIYNGIFLIGLTINANAMFGPNSITGMSFFNSDSGPKALYFCRLCGILGLFYTSANWLFNIDAFKLAKLDLVMNIAFLKVQHGIVFNGLQGATSSWNSQFYVQGFIVFMNAAVVIYNTNLKKNALKLE